MSDFEVNVGDLRTQITLQEPTLSKDASGAQKPAWANVGTNPTVWARWVNDHGLELIQNGAEKEKQLATVTIRYRSDIKTTWQVLKDGAAWEILSVDEVHDRNHWIVLRVQQTKGTI